MKILKCLLATLVISAISLSASQAQTDISQILTLNDQRIETMRILKAGTPLEKALDVVESKYNVSFLYENHLLASKKLKSELVLYNDDVTSAIRSVIKDYPLALTQLDARIFGIILDREAWLRAQPDPTVEGTVTDADGEPLPGVNIIVKGTTIGTSSEGDGTYALQVPSLRDTLVFSFIGFQRQEVPISGRTQIDVAMAAETYAGEELVVVGYGTRTKETLTGAVSAVSGDALEKVPITNVSNTLAGRLPGVVTITDSGLPGDDASTIRIRGVHTLNDNSPLIVIDGVPDRSGGLSRLNPRDIESISVLKDASAAIYGSRAANGVILVTTKRGRAGQAPQFSLSFNQGFNQPTRVPEMADAATYMRMLNELDMYDGEPLRYPQDEIQKHENIAEQDPWLYHDTDWFAEALKPMSYQTRANMSVSGGSENITYYLSLGGLTEDGFYENSSTQYNQYNFRSNIDATITDNISLRFDVSGRFEDRNYPTQSAGATFRMLMRGKPNEPAYWPNGLPGPDIENGQNPVVTGTDVTGYDHDDRYFLQSNLELSIEIPGIDGLGIRGRISYDKDFLQRKRWLTPWTLYTFNRAAYLAGGDPDTLLTPGLRPTNTEPQLEQWNEDNFNILMNLVAEYQQDLEDHSFGILVGTERTNFRNSEFSAFRRNYISSQIDLLFAGGEDQRANDGNAEHGARLNFFSRINYDYQDKYLFEFIGRYDGSYIFPEGNRFGFFPAFSVGWRLTEEEFFTDNVGFFDELKLRASWGQTGNDRIDPYQFLPTYGFGGGYIFGIDTEVTSVYQLRTPNPNVTWEVANQFDVGIEGAILDNRLSFTIDYFDYLRTDILHQRNASVPQTTGLSLPEENIGEVSSWGYDGSITWRQVVNNDFLYDITLNAGYATNEIQFWDEPPGAEEWQRSTGAKMETELYYNAIGIFQDQEHVDSYPHWPGARPGDIIFEDVDGNGEINANDRIRMDRNHIPEWTGGLTFSGSYKHFDFTVFLQGAAGASRYVQTESGEFGNYFQYFAERRWRPDPNNPNAPHPDYGTFEGPRAFTRTEEYWIANRNTYFFRKSDYLRLKSVAIGYNLPPALTDKLGMQNMRVYVNGFNLFTWDTFKLMDPERDPDAEGGAYYPQKRVVNVGLSVTF